MKKSIKIYHSCKEKLPSTEKIPYSDITSHLSNLESKTFLKAKNSFLIIEIFETEKSIFSNDYFNTIDIFSIYKDGVVFFSSSKIPWSSDKPVEWDVYRQKFIDFFSSFLTEKSRSINGIYQYLSFCMKFNLLEIIEMDITDEENILPKNFLNEVKLSRELKLFEIEIKKKQENNNRLIRNTAPNELNIATQRPFNLELEKKLTSMCQNYVYPPLILLNNDYFFYNRTVSSELYKNNDLIYDIKSLFNFYKSNSELQIRFFMEVFDILPVKFVMSMIKKLNWSNKHQMAYVFYRAFKKFSYLKKYKLAFSYSKFLTDLIKQGVNLKFYNYIRNEALKCVKEKNWKFILTNALDTIDKHSIFSIHLVENRPHNIKEKDFCVKKVKIECESIFRSNDSNVVFKGINQKNYCSKMFSININFDYITKAFICGIQGKLVYANKKIFFPVYKRLTEPTSKICIVFNIEKIFNNHEELEDVEVELQKIIFQNEIEYKLDDFVIKIIRKKCDIEVLDLEWQGEKRMLKVKLIKTDDFNPRIISKNIVRVEDNILFLEMSNKRKEACVVKYEIVENIFEMLEID